MLSLPTQRKQVYFFSSSAIQGFVAFNAIKTKERNYCYQHHTNQFLLLIIEIFECLHKQACLFLLDCANAIWNFERLKTLRDEGLRFKVYFYLSKNISYIAKLASSILSNNNRPNYFLTSTVSKHKPIDRGNWFL